MLFFEGFYIHFDIIYTIIHIFIVTSIRIMKIFDLIAKLLRKIIMKILGL